MVQAIRAALYGFGTVVLGTALAASGLSDTQVGPGLHGDARRDGARHHRRRRGRGPGRTPPHLRGAARRCSGISGTVFALTSIVRDLDRRRPDRHDVHRRQRIRADHVVGAGDDRAGASGQPGSTSSAGTTRWRSWRARSAPWRPEGRRSSAAVMSGAPTAQRWLLLFPVGALACLLIARRLSPSVEAAGASHAQHPLERSRKTVFKLSSLFALDAFAGGFVVTTFIVFWFERKFGASSQLMSLVVFAGGAPAGRLVDHGEPRRSPVRAAQHDGLLPPPVERPAAAHPVHADARLRRSRCCCCGSSLSQMDVPTRQAYISAMVDPEERTAAAAFTNTARYVARPFGPVDRHGADDRTWRSARRSWWRAR